MIENMMSLVGKLLHDAFTERYIESSVFRKSLNKL